MSDQKNRDELIDKRLDEFNVSAGLEGLDLPPEEIDELKKKLKSGKSVDEIVQEIIAESENPT